VAALAVVAVVAALPASAAEPDERRTLTVGGTGLVASVPDTAEWSFGVESRAASARGALTASAAKIRRVVAALRAAGVARKDIQTQEASLYPRLNERTNQVTGYVSSSRVRVIVRDLSRVGGVIEGAVEAGATDVYGPSLSRSNREELYRDALDRAYDAARSKAERLAAKLGVTLGRPVEVVEGGTTGEIYSAAKAEALAMDVEPGEDEIEATLTVTFAVS